MCKRVADMTPEELERVRKYRRERPLVGHFEQDCDFDEFLA